MRIYFLGTLKLKKPVGYNRENEKRGWAFQKACLFVDTEYASDCILQIH
jgi:hypothetical protein